MKKQSEAFDTRVELLAGELELALKWDRPAILLAIYASEFVRLEAQAALTEEIRELGHQVVEYRVTAPEDADVPQALAHHPEREGSVFFVSGLRHGGGEEGLLAYRALNLRREYFTEYRLRAVFWLTESEAATLPRAAPDFWAFRHRAVEFVEAPKPEKVAPVARELAWAGFSDRTLREDTDAKIALRDGLLHDLSEGDETLAARADLLYTLGALYGTNHDHETAQDHFERALAIFERLDNVRMQSACWNGLGNVLRAQGRLEEAERAYRRALDLDPEFAYAWNNLGIVLRQQGQLEEAERAYRRALDLDPEDANAWNGLGNVLRDQGQREEAEQAYRRAAELDPKEPASHTMLASILELQDRVDEALAEHRRAVELDPENGMRHASLASVLRKMDRNEEAQEHLARARDLLSRDDHYNWGCLEAIAGNVDAALDHLEQSLAQSPGYRVWARRDPDLEALHGHPRFEALVGSSA